MAETAEQYIQRILGNLEGQDPVKVQSGTAAKLKKLIRGLPPKKLKWKAAPDKWSIAQIAAIHGERIEHHQRRRSARAQKLDPRRRRVQPRHQGREVIATVAGGNHDLTVENERSAAHPGERCHQLGEVAPEGTVVAAAKLDLLAVPEAQAPEAVPLRLI